MKALMVCLIGLLIFVESGTAAQPTVSGLVRRADGLPVGGARVALFDLTDLRRGPVARATTDAAGQFALRLGALESGMALPQGTRLGQSYPNPFNPSAVIPYELGETSQVRLEVFNLLGQRLGVLVDGAQSAGVYQARWDGTDASGDAAAAGVYLYRLTVDGVSQTRRMVLVDGQAGVPMGGAGVEGMPMAAGATYGLVVAGAGVAMYVDSAFRVEAGMAPVAIEVEAQGRAKVVQGDGGVLGDVDNNGQVNLIDALLVAMYIADPASVLPNGGDIALGDVTGDGVLNLVDAWFIATYALDPSAAGLPPGIGEPIGGPLERTFALPGGAEMSMVWIEPGTFQMGSPASERSDCPSCGDEGPVHEVEISRGFWLGKYETTQGQWEAVMGETPWADGSYVYEVQVNPSHPAVYISWEDVQRFMGRLNAAAGDSLYRLPTEAEWEYACRAGTTTRWSFGDDESELRDYAWYGANAWDVGEAYAHAVGTKLPNGWGLHDMHGNVWEWVQDSYGSYNSTRQFHPRGAFRVMRGGAFNDAGQYLRSARRISSSPGFRFNHVGVRPLRLR